MATMVLESILYDTDREVAVYLSSFLKAQVQVQRVLLHNFFF